MRYCFIVFAEPCAVFQGVHCTIDGAAHNAAGLGAAAMPDRAPITVDRIRTLLGRTPTISFSCDTGEEFSAIRIERHAIGV